MQTDYQKVIRIASNFGESYIYRPDRGWLLKSGVWTQDVFNAATHGNFNSTREAISKLKTTHKVKRIRSKSSSDDKYQYVLIV